MLKLHQILILAVVVTLCSGNAVTNFEDNITTQGGHIMDIFHSLINFFFNPSIVVHKEESTGNRLRQVQAPLTLPQEGHTYKIQGWNTYCLVVMDWSTADNYVTEMSVCDGDIALWIPKFVPGFPGYVNLVNKYTGKCLSSGKDLSGADNNTPVLQYTCVASGSYAQLWKVDPDTQYLFWSGFRGNGGRCLSYNDSWKGQLYLYDCDTRSYNNQRLHLVEYIAPTSD